MLNLHNLINERLRLFVIRTSMKIYVETLIITIISYLINRMI